SALFELGKFDAAEEALRTASARKAGRADVRSKLGVVLLAKGRTADAEAAQRDALRRVDPHDPVYAEAWLRLADVISLAGAPRRDRPRRPRVRRGGEGRSVECARLFRARRGAPRPGRRRRRGGAASQGAETRRRRRDDVAQSRLGAAPSRPRRRRGGGARRSV